MNLLDITINGVDLSGYIQRASLQTNTPNGQIRITLELELLLPQGMRPEDITTPQRALSPGQRVIGP